MVAPILGHHAVQSDLQLVHAGLVASKVSTLEALRPHQLNHTHSTWHRPNSFYQILYACLGISQATFTLLA